MSYLEQLKAAIKEQFDKATDKQSIDTLSNINSLVEGAEKEHQALESKNAELIASYKDVVAHTSFKPKAMEPTPDQVQSGEMPDLGEFLSKFMDAQNK